MTHSDTVAEILCKIIVQWCAAGGNVTALAFKMYLWGEAGWSSSLNQDNLRSGSREQICLYFKAAPLFVMIRFPKYTNVDSFGEPASVKRSFFFFPMGSWLLVIFRFGIRRPSWLFIGSWVSGSHSFGNTVCIGIWKCLEKREISFKTVLSIDKGWRIYPSSCTERYWD